MRKTSWAITLAALGLCLGLCLSPLLLQGQEQLPPPKQGAQLEGYWSCIGQQGESSYEGVVVVKQVEGSGVYAVQWSSLGGAITGVGRLEDGTLVIGWSNGKGAGLTVMKAAAGGWGGYYVTLPTDGKTHKETWTFLKHLAAKDVLP